MTDRRHTDARKRAAASNHLDEAALLGELQHRVRNTLAVVRSIVRRTAEHSATVEDMASHLEGRIDAFARVQSMVTRRPGSGVDLASLILDEMLAHAVEEGDRLRIEGPDVSLLPRPAESMSLAIHELATNAVKYGALSDGSGRIDVRWTLNDGRLRLRWTERGLVAPIAPPQGRGFGLELFERTLAYELGAEVRVAFPPEGAEFEAAMPVERVIAP
jgi:two-component system CheB/CheR fusion protein